MRNWNVHFRKNTFFFIFLSPVNMAGPKQLENFKFPKPTFGIKNP